jgi:hypothetical protein
MKLTKSKLKEMVREEIQKLNEYNPWKWIETVKDKKGKALKMGRKYRSYQYGEVIFLKFGPKETMYLKSPITGKIRTGVDNAKDMVRI